MSTVGLEEKTAKVVQFLIPSDSLVSALETPPTLGETSIVPLGVVQESSTTVDVRLRVFTSSPVSKTTHWNESIH